MRSDFKIVEKLQKCGGNYKGVKQFVNFEKSCKIVDIIISMEQIVKMSSKSLGVLE